YYIFITNFYIISFYSKKIKTLLLPFSILFLNIASSSFIPIKTFPMRELVFLISLNNKKRKLKPADNLYSHFISFTSVLRTLAYFLALVKCRVTGLNTPLLSLRKPKTADLLFLSSKNMTSNFIVFLDKSLATMQQLVSLDIEDIADKLT
ncbi:TPA: hypothetical protein ACQXUS_001999, partial [Streptococcus pneumoniae]